MTRDQEVRLQEARARVHNMEQMLARKEALTFGEIVGCIVVRDRCLATIDTLTQRIH